MKVGIIGSGGREHSICEILKKSNNITDIYCFPGNAGTALIADNIDINIDNYDQFKNFILDKKIDLVIVGPEKPLVDGIVNYLEENGFLLIKQKPMYVDSFYVCMLSEKYKGSKLWFLKGLCVGLCSNFISFFTKSFSSTMFVFKNQI